MKYSIVPVHISTIRPGSTVVIDGELKTVCPGDIKTGGLFGPTLFGDSYRAGTTPVQLAVIECPPKSDTYRQLKAIALGSCVRLLDPAQMRVWEGQAEDAEAALKLAHSLDGFVKQKGWTEPSGWRWVEITKEDAA